MLLKRFFKRFNNNGFSWYYELVLATFAKN